MNRPVCYYFGGCHLHSGQYADLLHALCHHGIKSHLVLSSTQPWVRMTGPNPAERLEARFGGRVFLVPHRRVLFHISMLALLSRALLRRERVILHARQVTAARRLLYLKRLFGHRLALVAELEGDPIAEQQYCLALQPSITLDPGMMRPQETILQEERLVGRRSDAVLCVTEALRQLVLERNPDRDPAKIHVFPSYASREQFFFSPANRTRAREILGLSGRYVLVYAGNLKSPWQLPGKLVEVFSLLRQVRQDAFFLVLTPPVESDVIRRPLSARHSACDFRIFDCPHERVLDCLCAADAALLLREPHRMNRVACPGKAAEYLLTGLPVILTRGIGDYDQGLQQRPEVCLLSDLHDPALIMRQIEPFCHRPFPEEERIRFASWAANHFSLEAHVPSLVGLYRRL